ncbi:MULTISPECIES: flagellar hook-basal body complex protein FliE [unclassified Sphingomonas]|jgi:flagellar hook-basal body complex protein FliE|uniref:flagellar hook-basal body complex protein FliE n=1 Tax=unclassified Sphingomonas TaxID=196159 RepID=UPI000A598072|nr:MULTISPECIES: flagellar hook-basal body complex protein FliE [unclassified Sphingomonas]
MTGIEGIAAIGHADAAPIAMRLGEATATVAQPAGGAGFGEVLMSGLRGVDQKIATADKLVQQFTIDDSVPVHQVTMALEQARLSVELAMQVRSRIVEGYREIMNIPL